MNKTRTFHILIPAALALTSAGFAQASADEVPRMSDDVYRTSVSFCANVAAAEKVACQGDMIAAGSRIVAAIGGLPPASAASIDEGARNKLPAAERKGLAPVEPRAIDRDDDVAGLAGMVRLCDVYESEPASRARHHAALKQQAPDAAPRVEALLADASTAARQRVSIGVWQILALEGPEASARACTQLGTGS
ncbi:hypothetical protein WT01_33695 [Burkholderia cepacia]|uniref:hypothetical protein n=1 Tax=Burkholderia cepacia TaxID=292 RepID=UPI00075967E7|nr:hypothetical protein [Burkholderia cepacia]KVK96689.1 hypothetical protein WS93_23685 [Burkholderia cepacia]KVL47684.1 hypothetical protein WT01_33695 [Burkholderia cepacia]